MIADRTLYDVRYSYRPVCVIAVVSLHIYLFTYLVSNWGRLLVTASDFCHLWLNDTSYSKSVKKRIGSPLLLSTPYADPECHNTNCHRQTDRQTDRRHYQANSRSHCVQQYDRLKNYVGTIHWGSSGKTGDDPRGLDILLSVDWLIKVVNFLAIASCPFLMAKSNGVSPLSFFLLTWAPHLNHVYRHTTWN